MSPTIDLYLPGQAKTKGSLKPVGNGRMIEGNVDSKTWREKIANAIHDRIRCCCDDQNCDKLIEGYPMSGALAMHLLVTCPRPKSLPKKVTEPITRSSGDLDKLIRNVFDALKDAGAINDDAQFVEEWTRKSFAEPGRVPGARIRVFPAPAKTALPTDQSLDLGRRAGRPTTGETA